MLGGFGRDLEIRLADAPTWEARFDLLDRVIMERLDPMPRVPPAVCHAWRTLVANAGQVEHRRARARNWVESQTFRRAVLGAHRASPKAMARVLRFGRAAELLKVSERGRFAEIAYECGYYDQAHFTRDFTAFAGVSPSVLLASQLPNRGGFVV